MLLLRLQRATFAGDPFSRRKGAPLPQLRAAAKPSQGGEREIGGAKGPQTPPSDRSHKLSPPTLNASTPRDPSGVRKGVCTQVGVALDWIREGIIYPQQRWVARGQGVVDWWQWWSRGPVLS